MSVSHAFTVADLENTPDDGNRYEVIAGELYVSSAPDAEHQVICARLIGHLYGWSEQSGGGEVLTEPGVVFAVDHAVIPDVVWISLERLELALGQDGRLHIAPELVVEVLSPGVQNEKRDRELKRKLYSRQGVQEYWIVDRVARLVEIHRRDHAALQLVATLAVQDELTSPLLPGFCLPLTTLFRPLRQPRLS